MNKSKVSDVVQAKSNRISTNISKCCKIKEKRMEKRKKRRGEQIERNKKRKGKGTDMKIETPGIEINKEKMHLDSLRKEEKGRTS